MENDVSLIKVLMKLCTRSYVRPSRSSLGGGRTPGLMLLTKMPAAKRFDTFKATT